MTADRSSDHLIRCMAWGGRVRIVAGITSHMVEELRSIHEPSPPATAAVGRLATGALLLAATLEKVTGREPMLTVEVDGGGPAGRILATASPTGWVRAMITHPEASADPVVNGKLNVAGVVGRDGFLTVTRDPGIGEPYRGVVPLQTGEIASDLAHYLSDSEQTPAAVELGVFVSGDGRVGNAGGFLVQLMPGVSDEEAERLTGRIRRFGPVTTRVAAGQGPSEWLQELFHEGVEQLETTAVRFVCGCSTERVETALKLLGADELSGLLASTDDRPATLTCGFCHTPYQVTRVKLTELLAEIERESASG